MSNVRASQSAAIISLNDFPNTRASQFAVIISSSDIPDIRVSQFSLIMSISPGKPLLHYAVNVKCKGPLTLLEDMTVAGRK